MNVAALKKNPFKLGDYLLNEFNGMSHTEVAEVIEELNRHAVRIYRRIGEMSPAVRAFVEENNIKSTPLIKAAQKSDLYKDEKALIAFLSEYKKENNEKRSTPVNLKAVKSMDNVINIDKSSASTTREIEELKGIILAQEKKIKDFEKAILKKDNKKENKFKFSISSLLTKGVLLVAATYLTFYLIYQSYDFLSFNAKAGLFNIGSFGIFNDLTIHLKSLAQAITMEIVLLICAFLLHASKSKIYKIASGTILVLIIGGFGVYMHSGLENKEFSNNSVVANLEAQKVDLRKANEKSRSESDALPKNYYERKKEYTNLINANLTKIAEIDKEIKLEGATLSKNSSKMVITETGIRVFAMIVNVLLVHFVLFTGVFKKSEEL